MFRKLSASILSLSMALLGSPLPVLATDGGGEVIVDGQPVESSTIGIQQIAENGGVADPFLEQMIDSQAITQGSLGPVEPDPVVEETDLAVSAQTLLQWLSGLLGNAIQSSGITFDAAGRPWITIQAQGGYTIWLGYGPSAGGTLQPGLPGFPNNPAPGDFVYILYVTQTQNGQVVPVIHENYLYLASFLTAVNNLTARIRARHSTVWWIFNR